MKIEFEGEDLFACIASIRVFMDRLQFPLPITVFAEAPHPELAALEDEPWDKNAEETVGDILERTDPKQKSDAKDSATAGKRRRRTLHGATPAPAEEEQEVSRDPAVKPARKGRTKVAAKPKKGSRTQLNGAADADISDQDMQNAASEGAKKILPAGVKAVMKKFDVKKVVDVPQAKRREFLNEIESFASE
jgi:hypothetical protein